MRHSGMKGCVLMNNQIIELKTATGPMKTAVYKPEGDGPVARSRRVHGCRWFA